MPSANTIARNLRALRDLRGQSQVELARAVGISRRTVARLEAAEIEDPGVEQCRRLAAALGVTLSMLVEAPLVAVSIPVPEALREALEGRNGPAVLERLVKG